MASLYRRHRFPPEVISHAVWLYHRFTLRFRDVEDLLAKRDISSFYESIRYWGQKFGPSYARKLKRKQGRLGYGFGTTNATLNLARVTATYSLSGDFNFVASPSLKYSSIGFVGKIITRSNVLPLATPIFMAGKF